MRARTGFKTTYRESSNRCASFYNIKCLFNGAAKLIDFKTLVLVRRLKRFCFEHGSGIRVQIIFLRE